MARITNVEQLAALYGPVGEASTAKVARHVTPEYATMIAASPFAVLATCGPEGLDCSPRGDRPGFLRVHDDRTLMLPDRRGNNRIDSLRNVVRDPRVALLLLIPGSGSTLRVNGRGYLETDTALLASFEVDGKAPRSVLVIEIGEVYFQCARATVRSRLWEAAGHVDPKSLPTPGEILAALSNDRVGGAEYDRTWGERARQTMW